MNKTLLIAALAGFVALIFAAVGTSSLAIVPDVNLRLIERAVCPQGQELEYRELGQYTYTDAEGTHNRERMSISCVSVDGTRYVGKGTAAISALMGLYFLTCFVPLSTSAVLFRRSMIRRSNGSQRATSE